MQLNSFADWVGFGMAIFCVWVVGMSITIMFYYSAKKHRHLFHIALMAASYFKFVLLVTGAINFRVFYEGEVRAICALIASVAAVEGILGLLLMFRRRKIGLIHNTEK